MAKYVFYNRNPYKELEDDCVCRSISLATDMPYEVIEEKLELVGDLFDCDYLCQSCYKFLIEDVYCGVPVNCDWLYPDEFADENPYGTYLLRISGHILCVIDDTIYDTFDSRYDGIVTDAWCVVPGLRKIENWY